MTAKEERDLPDWDDHYRNEEVREMPWFFADLDPDVVSALEGSEPSPAGELRALDLGTGPGTQAIELARRGFAVTASDVAAEAIAKARELAAESGVADDIDFAVDDILASKLDGQFDLVLDRGVFHVFTEEERPAYLRHIARLVRHGGTLMLKCFSEKETMDEGPYRFSAEQVREYFSPDFEIVSIEETVYYGSIEPRPLALFTVMRRRS